MITTKTTGLTLLLLFASSVAAQESSGYGVSQGINCFGKEYVCVGPLNYKHCDSDAQGNTYAVGNVIQCPFNHRCVNDGVEICIPLKLSTTAPQSAPLITSEQIPVNSISTEDPIKLIPLKWESTTKIPDTTIDIVVNKEPSSIPVDTTTAAEGSIWTTFLTENPYPYNTLGSQSANTNIPLTTGAALGTTTEAIIETTTFQNGAPITSDTYTTLTPIIWDDSSLPVKSNNLLETGSIVDVTHISIDEIALKNQASETTTARNIPSDPNITDNYYSTISTPESSNSRTDIYPGTIITANVGQYVSFETKTPIDANPTTSPEGSTGTSPTIEPVETTTLIDQSITFDSNAPVNPSELNIQNKTPAGPNSQSFNENVSSHPSTLLSNSLSVEHNPLVDPNIPIELSSLTDHNATSISVDQTNTGIPNSSSVPSAPASSSLSVEQHSPVVSSDPKTLPSSNLTVEHNSPVDPNTPIDLSSSTDPNTTNIPVDQINSNIPSTSSDSIKPASSSLPVELILSVVSSDSNTLTSSNLPVGQNSPMDPNIPIVLISSTDPNTTAIPVDQTNTVIPNYSSVPSTLASSSLPVAQNSPVVSSDSTILASSNFPIEHNSPVDLYIPIHLSSSTDPNATTISVDQTLSVPSTPASSSLSVEQNSPVVPSDPTTMPISNLPVEHNSPVDPNNPIDLSSSTDPNTTAIPVDQTNSNTPSTSLDSSKPASSSLPVEHISSVVSSDPTTLTSSNLPGGHNPPADPNNPVDLSSLTDPNTTAIPVDQTNSNAPSTSLESIKPASSSLPVEHISSVISSDPSTLTSSNLPVGQNSPVDHNIPIVLISSTDPNATIISVDQTSSVPSTPASSSLSVEQKSPVVPSDPTTMPISNLPVEHNSPVDPNNPIDLSSSTDPNTTAIPVDQTNSNTPSTSLDSNKPASPILPVEHNSPVVSSDPSTLENPSLPVKHNSPVYPNQSGLSLSTNSNTATIPVHQINAIVPRVPSDPGSLVSSNLPSEQKSPMVPKIPIDSSSSTEPNIINIKVDQTFTITPSASSGPSIPVSSIFPVQRNSALEILTELKVTTDSNAVLSSRIPHDYKTSVDANNTNDLKTPSDPSAPASSLLPVEHNYPVNSNITYELSALPSSANIPLEKNNPIILSTSSDPNSPANSSLPVNPDNPIELNVSSDPKTASIPNIPSVASDPSPAISGAPVKSSSLPSLLLEHYLPLDDTNQFGLRSPVIKNTNLEPGPSTNLDSPEASANQILQVDPNVPIPASRLVENYAPSRNQQGRPKEPVNSNSPANTKAPISPVASTNINHLRTSASPISPNTLIGSNANQPVNIPTDFSASAGPNKPVDHTLPIHSSDLHTYTNNGLVLLPKHPLRSRQPISTKKSNHQETIETESSEANSKSVLKEDESIEEKSKSNKKKSKRQKNSRNNKRKEETVENESIEISLQEKRQNKDTSVETKSEANSKESKDSKDFQEDNIKIERKSDDEYDESASSEQKELIKKILKKIKDNKCDEDDVYPDPKDCKKYHRCVKKNHKTRITHLRCDSGDRFDSDKLKCVDKRKAKCFSKEDFIEEFA